MNEDPILRTRAKLGLLAERAKKLGYHLFLSALIIFIISFTTEFNAASTSTIVALLIGGSVILAPSIILGYAVKAAEREDLGLPHGH